VLLLGNASGKVTSSVASVLAAVHNAFASWGHTGHSLSMLSAIICYRRDILVVCACIAYAGNPRVYIGHLTWSHFSTCFGVYLAPFLGAIVYPRFGVKRKPTDGVTGHWFWCHGRTGDAKNLPHFWSNYDTVVFTVCIWNKAVVSLAHCWIW
jgi:hypothetical protein